MYNTLAITNFVSESFFAVHGLNFFFGQSVYRFECVVKGFLIVNLE